jgi:maltooligosyltrehalose trehalohydrolase
LVTQVAEAPLAAALAITLLAPMPPLLFMGEEWGARTPFPFFCDFPEPLASAVRKGRRAEFSEAYAALGERIPDPLAESTFRAAILDWGSRASAAGRQRLDLVRELLALRRRERPYLAGARFGAAQHRDRLLQAHWRLAGGRSLLLLANLSDLPAAMPAQARTGRLIWGAEQAGELAPWAALWRIGAD